MKIQMIGLYHINMQIMLIKSVLIVKIWPQVNSFKILTTSDKK